MSSSSALALPGRGAALARFGEWLARHQGAIRLTQWAVIAVYAVLVAVPSALELPPRTAHIWSDLTLFAQFAFWGIWWPFVLLSMVVVGRAWCGLLCPEGALTEFASRWSLGRHVPRWLTWPGWPFVAFSLTTIYGQMVSVYQYPKPVLLILGGSTAGAIAIGLVYGRNKRVWCRYLCPVNGVFGLLAKLAPVAFQVDGAAWRRSPHPGRRGAAVVNCAPLVPIRTMRSATPCHMCGRCSGFRGAVQLAPRSPNHEIVRVSASTASGWDSALILFGLMGVALGAFQWTSSPWLVDAKQLSAEWLVEHGITWPLERSAPWWLLTNYPAQNDVLTLLDGFLLLAYIGLVAAAAGAALSACLALSVRAAGPFSGRRFHHLAHALLPMAGCGVFLGLFGITTTMLKAEGMPMFWLPGLRAGMLAGAAAWSAWLAWQVIGAWAPAPPRHVLAWLFAAAALAIALSGWGLLFFVW